MATTHYRTCHLCEAMCGVAIEVEGSEIRAVRGDPDDPFSRGHICPKAVALKDVHEDPDRLRQPQRRTASGWRTIPWDEALDETAERLGAIRDAHGANAVASYLGNPTVHNHGALIFGVPFLRALGTRNRFSATSVDQLPHMLAALEMFGHQLLLPVPDIDRTDLFVVLGGNPLVSNGSLMTAGGIERRIKDMQRRGGRLVVVDPRRTETAAIADQHLFIRPGADAWLLAAVAHTLFEEGLVELGRLVAFTDGVDAVRAAVTPFVPETVAPVTGIDAAAIRALARELAAAERAVVYGRVGACTQEFGGLAAWLVNVLNVLTGNLDRAGGAMFTTPAIDFVDVSARGGERGHFDKGRTRVSGLPEFGGEYPVVALAEEIETPGEGQVRALVTSAGNPVLSTPNGRRLDRALETLEFMVSIDIYVNETTRHADIILPPTFALEHDHYDVAFHLLAVRNTARYCPPLFAPERGAKHDWEIYLELASRLAARGGPRGRALSGLARAVGKRVGPRGLLAYLLRSGPHGAGFKPGAKGLSLGALEKAPHGVDLGPLEPRLPERLYRRDRRVALAPQRLVEDLERLERRLAESCDATANGSLSLIGRRQLRSNNSWMHNSERLVKGKERCTLLMHPDDAAKRGLENGQAVRVSSRVGSVDAPLEVSEEMMPGVVSLPHGWGHDRPGVRLSVASAHAGVSLNDLTDEQSIDSLSGTARLNGVPVEVVAATPTGG